ncbi:MAG: SIS domain-containing protein, partial [Thermoplasmata archaeon]|nr:SIS domain-containing protein [Thermoplasmata archaeon]
MVAFPSPRSRHPFYMHEMIHRQPSFLRETISKVGCVNAASLLRKPRRLILTGCGTSFHAAMYGARILQRSMGDSIAVEATHAYDLAFGALPKSGTVLGVSHSGSTPTTNRALARAKRAGLRTLGLSGLPATAMESIIDDVLVIGSIHDRSWANTMSYTTQLTAFALLAAALGDP